MEEIKNKQDYKRDFNTKYPYYIQVNLYLKNL